MSTSSDFNNKVEIRKIELLNRKFNFPLKIEDLNLVHIKNGIACQYIPSDREKRFIFVLLEIFGAGYEEYFTPIENSDLLYFNYVNELSEGLRFLIYDDKNLQDIFMYEYLHGDDK